MSKTEDAYHAAAAEFIEAKQGKNEAAYRKAKDKLHKARAKWRTERDKAEGVVVGPAPITAKSSVNGG